MPRYATALLLTLLLALPARAQLGGSSDASDPLVRQALDAEGWSYEVDADDDFKLVVSFSGSERTQLVYVRSRTSEVGGIEIREVWSPVYTTDSGTDVPPAVAQWALRKAWNLKLGSLASSGSGTIYFVAKIAPDATPGVLSTVIRTAASTADDLEQEQSSGDAL